MAAMKRVTVLLPEQLWTDLAMAASMRAQSRGVFVRSVLERETDRSLVMAGLKVESVGRTPIPARSFKPPVPLTPPEALLEMTRYYRDRVIVEGETEDDAEAATRAEYKCVPGASEWLRPAYKDLEV